MQMISSGAANMAPSALAFVMLNATICEPPAISEGHDGYYDPESQTWIGNIPLGAGSYSQRSNGSKGEYSSQSDD